MNDQELGHSAMSNIMWSEVENIIGLVIHQTNRRKNKGNKLFVEA